MGSDLTHLQPLDKSDGVGQRLVPRLNQLLPISDRLHLLGLQGGHGPEERRVVGIAAESLVVRLKGEGRVCNGGVPGGGVVARED